AFVKRCDTCTHFLPGLRYQAPPGFFSASQPWEQLTLDVVHIERRNAKYPLALCALDTFSRFAVIMPLKGESADEQILAIKNHIFPLGVPSVIVIDRHPTYTSKKFTEFLSTAKIEASISPGYSSTHVALINRLHRTIRELLAKSVPEGDDWVDSAWLATAAYNGSVHPATGFTPYFLVYNRPMARAIDKILPNPYDGKSLPLANRLQIAERAREIVRERFRAERMHQLAEYDRKRSKQKRHPRVADRVMRLLDVHRRQGGKQAAVRAFGPYVITRINKDRVHCTIVGEQAVEGADGIEVRIDELVPIGDRPCTPIYSSMDVSGRKPEERQP
ncbi:transposase family protein, partial [Candidatus Kaiserbacteria bacterium]|nr:transposase family protein [Candidatus Kaiserbacteria bacterium]